ncbi:MFS transporter [Mycoplasmatota bacterium]|nr:MFS transporter [Mycoplasmatota bacterium]
MKKIRNLTGMQKFTFIWSGQFLSVMGSSMTRFAFLIWAYEQTGKASTTALLGFFAYLPYIILSPLAGIIVDKWDRKKIMIISDLFSGLLTIILLMTYLSNNMLIWYLFVFVAFSSALEAFQVPAYSASITVLIPKDKYGQASGMRSLSSNASLIAAPILTGALLGIIGFMGIMVIDIITFIFAVSTLLMVTFPKVLKDNISEKSHMLEDLKFSLKYLFDRRGLLYLLGVFMVINLLAATTYFGILPAYILARTNKNEVILGMVQTALGVGGVIGSLFVSIYGIPKKKIITIILTGMSSFLLGDILMGLGQTAFMWIIASVLSSLFLPLLMGAESALWQSKIEPSIQGRIFSIKGMLSLSMMPIGFLLGGFLADYVFEPMFMKQTVFTFLVGNNLGSGMGLMFLISGVLGTITCLSGYFIRSIRNVEGDLPDFDEIQ